MKLLVTATFVCLFLLAQSAEAAIYWVSKSGSDSNACNNVQSATQPTNLGANTRLTVNGGINCLGSGDTLYILPGTYGEPIWFQRNNSPSECIASLSGPGFFTACIPNGSAGAYTTVSAAPGFERQVTLRPIDNYDGWWGNEVIYMQGFVHHIRINGLRVDGTGTLHATIKVKCAPLPNAFNWSCAETVAGELSRIDFLVFSNNEIFGGNDTGILGDFFNFTVSGNDIHDNGHGGFDHGIYWEHGHTGVIENNNIHNNTGFGIHVYDDTGQWPHPDITIRNNYVHHNGTGVIYQLGQRGHIYNNVIAFNGQGQGIRIEGSTDTIIANNTIVGHQNTTGSSAACILYQIDAYGPNTARNNICYQNSADIVIGNVFPTFSLTQSNNLIGTNPLFVNSAAGDYQLTSGSAAINAGFSMASLFTTDANGVTRPQGAAWDIGACEWFSGAAFCPNLTAVTPPPAPVPTVQITTPTTNDTFSTGSPSIVIGGTGSGGTGATITSVACANNRGGACSITGTTNWTSAPITLSAGVNIITVTLTNSQGQNVSDVIFVTHVTTNVLRVHPTNRLWFTNSSGNAIYLGGHQIFWDLQDHAFGAPLTYGNQSALNFTNHMSFMTARNMNYLRTWQNLLSGGEATAPPGNVCPAALAAPQPYLRTGPGSAYDGGGLKFDLDQFNDAYFQRLHDRAVEAANNGIFLSIMLLDVYQWFGAEAPFGSLFICNAFHPGNNINGINADTNGDGFGIEFFTAPTPTLTTYHRRYVDKVLDTIADLDNVWIEIANEPGLSALQWQYDLVSYIRSKQATRTRQHLIHLTPGGVNGVSGGSVNYVYPSQSQILGGPGDTSALANAWQDWTVDPPINTWGKPIIFDADHNSRNTNISGYWRLFTRGYHLVMYDHPFHDPSEESDPQWERARRTAGAIANYANNRFPNLAAMTPSTSVSSSGFALVDPGQTYIVYHPTFTPVTVNLQAGNYTVEWFDVQSYSIVRTNTLAAPTTGNYMLTPSAPITADYVVYIRSSAVAPPVVALTSPTSQATYVDTTGSATAAMGGTASCPGSAVKTVDWVNSRGGSGTASGTINWTVTGIPINGFRRNDITLTLNCQDGQTATLLLQWVNGGLLPVALLALDAGSGTTPQDISGLGNHGVFAGSGTTWITGQFGNALSFNGSGSVNVADADSLDLSVMTVSLFANPSGLLADMRALLVKNYKYFLYGSVAGYCGGGGPLGGVAQATVGIACQGVPLTPGAWTHLAYSYDGATLRLYRDGVQVGTGTYGELPLEGAGLLQIAASQFGENWIGGIDEVQVWRGAVPLNNGTGDNCGDPSPSITKFMRCPLAAAAPPTGLKVKYGSNAAIKWGSDASIKYGATQ